MTINIIIGLVPPITTIEDVTTHILNIDIKGRPISNQISTIDDL